MNTHYYQTNTDASAGRLVLFLTTLVFAGSMIASSILGAHAQGVLKGNVFVPASSIQKPVDIGVRAHTNIQILVGPPNRKSGYDGGLGPGGGMSPAQIRQFYNLPSTGGGQIIAIVDAYDNPNALGDFNVFAQQFGLPTETSANVTASTNQVFQVLYAGGTKPPQDNSGGWEFEESLDVQWAHAMAPNAKILLVECDSNSFNDLYAGEDAATNYVDRNGWVPKEISNSWGGSEFGGEQAYDIHFQGTGAVYFASAGDDASPATYPSASPFVVSAGGTTVTTDANGNFVSESGWSDGGGGPSAVEPIPFFQESIAIITAAGGRGTPDLSFDADPNTGVSIYDTFLNNGWAVVGGTSVSSPSLAGIANNAATALGAYPAGTQVLSDTIYFNLGSVNFRDITTGNNGYAAGTGWDFVTGVGTCLGLGGLQPLGTLVANPQTIQVTIGNSPLITLTGSGSGSPPPILTYAIAVPPANGTLSGFDATTGRVTYTPNANYKGVDYFQFTVSTIGATSPTALVTLNVGPGTPTANPQTISVDRGALTDITLTGSDPDTPPLPLNFAIATLPSHGTLGTHDSGSGQITYTPDPGFVGTDSFTFAVDNGFNYSNIATVTLNVAIGKPTANSQTAAVKFDTASKVTLTGTDPDSPPLPLTFDIISSPEHGTLSAFSASSGMVTYTPNAGFQGTDSFLFTVSNGSYTSQSATVTLNIAAGTPTVTGQTIAVKHNTPANITLTGTDPDSPPLALTFAIGASPKNGSLSGLNASTGAVTYTPNTNFHGTDTFTFTATNGITTSAPATITLNVAVGTPTANPQSDAVKHGTATKLTLSGSDADTPTLPLTYAIASSPSHGALSSINSSTGAVTYTPSATYHGSDTFTFTVSNGTNVSTPATVTLTVSAGTPTANPQSLAVQHNTPVKITLSGADLDSPPLPLTYAISGSPQHGSLSGLNTSTGVVTYTPSAGFHGTDTFTFTVSNGTNTSAPAAVTLTVGVGTPSATPQAVTVTESKAISITLSGSDADLPALKLIFAIAAGPTHGTLGTLNTATGVVIYTPVKGYQGSDSFTFTVSNGTNTSAPAKVSLNVGGS